MKSASWLAAALGLLAAACGGSNSVIDYGAGSGARTGSPSAPVASQAADLRTHLDLLLAEQVVIVAKETAAAVNHDDAYVGYTSLLTANQSDLGTIVATAFGNTAADNFMNGWSMANAALVDYGIGVVTHNDARSSSAMSALSGTAMPKLAAQVSDMSGLAGDNMTQLLTQQAQDDKTFIDDLAGQRYASFYTDLQTAYFASVRLGDALAQRAAQKFSDRFPGDPTLPAVDRRVSLNLLLQQHAWLATMATDAVVASRDADKTAATAALGLNASALSRSVSDLLGAGVTADFDKAWGARDSALVAYAQKGDADSKSTLTATAAQVATAMHLQPGLVTTELNALIKAIDDQRSKASETIAGDDRAAATSMEPLADSIVS